MLGGDQTQGFIRAGQAHNQLSYFPGLQLIYIFFKCQRISKGKLNFP